MSNQPTKSRPSSISALNTSFSSTQETSDIPLKINSASITRNIPVNSSFKEQKKSYNLKKKYFNKNIQSAIESTQEIHSGWLKARTTFKRWTKVWCQVKPGYLIMYTSQEAQKKHRLGVVILSVCQVIKRPTKKDGFCFKLINPFGSSVWAKSSTRALAFSQASLTLRALDASIGKLWLDALHQCHLSANLDGCQSVVDEAFDLTEGMQCNRSDISDSDDGDQSTRQFESIMFSHSNSTSNNNSISSLNNYQSGSGKPFTNGNALLNQNSKNLKIGRSNQLMFREDENDNSFSLNKLTITDISSSQIGKNLLKNNNFTNIGSGFRPNKSTSDHEVAIASENLTTGLSLNSMKMVAKFSKYNWRELQLENVTYLGDEIEEFGIAGVQTEEVHDSNKNFLWHIIKQLSTGMDLSKITLPTFILEPRSFLEKLSDYFYHCDILSEAVLIEDPVMRLIRIVKWYLSGYYKKPNGPKKPYNPILGERFRCFWDHPRTQSRTFFLAEQVSHHPPISAYHVTNRKDGYTVTCALLSRSKFSGNSVAAILDGPAKLYLNKRKETYTITVPYANCRGILLGSLCLEFGGNVEIKCAETGCKCEIDFKLAPVWASSNSYNAISGRILSANRVTHTLDGHWDKKINIVDKSNDEKSVLWEVTDTIKNSRLKRYTVAMKDQDERESVKLWRKVTDALSINDQTVATAEKTVLENMQRQEARERRGAFIPENFQVQSETNEWSYRWQDNRPWNERRDIMQFEENFKIRTLMLNSNTPSKTNPSGEEISRISIPDPIIDLPLTKLNKFSGQIEQFRGNAKQAPGITRGDKLVKQFDKVQLDTFKSIESKIDAENMLIKQAIAKVTEKNKRLEEDLATLKRGKKFVAFVMATVIVAILSVIFKYFS